MRTFVLQDEDGQTQDSHSISAGLDYPGVGPEHSWLAEAGRAHYAPVTDAEAMEAFRLLARTEGIVPAIESAHALAGALTLGARLPARADGQPPLILVSLSGRGDKDVDTAIKWFDLDTSGTGRSPGADRRRALPPVELELGGPRPGPARSCERARASRAVSTATTAGYRRVRRDPGQSGRGALVGFLHVGYPSVPTSLAALRALTGEGELGRGRPGRGGPALQRPDDRRGDHPAGRHPGAGARRPHPRRLRRRRGRGRAPAPRRS